MHPPCMRWKNWDFVRFFRQFILQTGCKGRNPIQKQPNSFVRNTTYPPQQVAMVGDSVNDMRFAQNSGVLGIFYRPRGEEKLPDGAQWQIRSLQELLTLV